VAILPLELGPLDLTRLELRGVDGAVRISPKEGALLAYLAERPGQDVTREELLEQVFGYAPGVVSRTVDTTLQRLRGKVERDPANPRHLLTIHGTGYRFVPQDLERPGPTASPAVPPSPAAITNIGPATDRFVGREAELAELTALLCTHQLVTLHGPGGAGKTRLSREVGRRLAGSEFPGGVWFIDLTECRTVLDVIQAEARVLRVSLGDVTELDACVRKLGRALIARGRCLLIVDNAEQVVAEASPLMAGWLPMIPETSQLVTSREALRIAGEHIVPVDPLAESEAISLFVERARTVRPDFDGAPDDLAAVVNTLDRLPLALELAAARVQVLGLPELRRRLGDRFRLLASRRRDLSPRQRTLWGALEWSWDLLDDPHRRALTDLSVFAGGFDSELADAVVADEPGDPWVLDRLEALRDQSLVYRRVDDEGVRFGLLESVRAFASAKRLESGREAAAFARHRDAVIARAEALVPKLDSPTAISSLHALAAESDNLNAIRRRFPGLDAARAARLLHEVLLVRGPVELHRQVLNEAVAVPDLPPRLAFDLHLARARTRRQRGKLDGARADLAVAEALLPQLPPELEADLVLARGITEEAGGDLIGAEAIYRRGAQLALTPQSRLKAHALLAFVLWQQGRREEAEPLLRSALLQVEEHGLVTQAAKMMSTLGLILGERGVWTEALEVLQKARQGHLALGDRRGEGIVLANIANLTGQQGRREEAIGLYEQALAAQRAVGERRLQGVILRNLGVMLMQLGRTGEAEGRIHEALAMSPEAGDRNHEGRLLADLGELALHADDLAGAEARYAEAAEAAEAAGDHRYAAIVAGNRALVAHLQGRLDAATEAAEAAHALLLAHTAPRVQAHFRAYAATLAAERGDFAAADAHLQFARTTLAPIGDPSANATVSFCAAAVAWARGDSGRAAALEAEAADAGAPAHVGRRLLGRLKSALFQPET